MQNTTTLHTNFKVSFSSLRQYYKNLDKNEHINKKLRLEINLVQLCNTMSKHPKYYTHYTLTFFFAVVVFIDRKKVKPP